MCVLSIFKRHYIWDCFCAAMKRAGSWILLADIQLPFLPVSVEPKIGLLL